MSGKLVRMSGGVQTPSSMSGSCWEAIKDVRKCSDTLQYVRLLSGSPQRCPGVVWRPYRMSGSGWLALPDVWEWSGDHPGCPVGHHDHSQTSWSASRPLSDIRDSLLPTPGHP